MTQMLVRNNTRTLFLKSDTFASPTPWVVGRMYGKEHWIFSLPGGVPEEAGGGCGGGCQEPGGCQATGDQEGVAGLRGEGLVNGVL